MRWAKHDRLCVAYLCFSDVACCTLGADNVTNGVIGEYNTVCRDTLMSWTIYSMSPSSQKDLLGRVQRAVDQSGDGYGMVDVMCLSSVSTASPPLVTLVTVKFYCTPR